MHETVLDINFFINYMNNIKCTWREKKFGNLCNDDLEGCTCCTKDLKKLKWYLLTVLQFSEVLMSLEETEKSHTAVGIEDTYRVSSLVALHNSGATLMQMSSYMYSHTNVKLNWSILFNTIIAQRLTRSYFFLVQMR